MTLRGLLLGLVAVGTLIGGCVQAQTLGPAPYSDPQAISAGTANGFQTGPQVVATVASAVSTAVAPLETSTHAAATYDTPAARSAEIATVTVNGVSQVSHNIVLPVGGYVAGYTPASPGLVANLLSGSPCASGLLGQYAVVSNLYSGASNTNEVMRCGLTGTSYYWRPQRTDFAANVSTTGGNIAVTCMVSPPTMFVSGTLASALTLSLSSTNCWPGASANIANNATLGIFGITLTGLLGGATKSIGLGTRVTVYFDGTNWQVY